MSCASTGSRARSPSRSDEARNDRGGFTLLEVLVAFAVLAVALGVAFEIFATGLRGGQAADALTRAVLIAESRLDRVGVETELTPGESAGESDDGTRWRVEIREQPAEEETGDDDDIETPGLPTLLDIIVTVSWRERGGEQSFTLATSRLVPGEVD